MVDKEIIDRLRDNPKDLIVVASWFYKIGSPIISDSEYNIVSSTVGDLDFVWDELDAPVDLFNKYGIKYDDISFEDVSGNKYFKEYMDSLYDAGTKSCNPCYDEREIYDKMMAMKSITSEIVVSLKVDGVSTRNIIEQNNGVWNLVASLSRSRESKGFDYTDGMKLSVPKNLAFSDDIGEVHEHSNKRVLFAFGEAYVERSALEYLRHKYHSVKAWKTPRSTAFSMLRDIIAEEDYKYLKFKCFKLSTGRTLSEMFEIASNAGLDVVPYEVIQTEDIPSSYDRWTYWFNWLVDKYYNIQVSQDIEADGIVIAVNNQNEFNKLGVSNNGKYNNGMFSCKVGPWGSTVYTSRVVKIHFDNSGNTSEFSVVAEIEPVEVANGNTVTRVNCFNPKILIDNKINVGSYIRFEYKSASSIVLVYR